MKIKLKLIAKILVSLLVIVVGGYYLSYFLLPSITVFNHTSEKIKQFEITLPSSHLDFGSIAPGTQNTLHYTLAQKDGVYRYKTLFASGTEVSGECGYLTHNELHKRVIVIININKEVSCEWQ
ncbi:hypothetical protein HII17_10485 [Thalassotalea sp. M1531]|uniref:Uncharacterized protein n=1 Tax=Thalassotalea algicola TaxID=2716224 RepID=A0A7Y0LD55_9GAMM|nr:hypothetical protein [Thalassotalea algicola]NMP31994.1 hypothetical protein [Thalassotalea algicola]